MIQTMKPTSRPKVPTRHIAETDIATRFHHVIYPVKLGKPTVSIGNVKKGDVLTAEMGVGRCCRHIERLNLDFLIEQFTQLIPGRQRYGPNIRDTNLADQEGFNPKNPLLEPRLLQP